MHFDSTIFGYSLIQGVPIREVVAAMYTCGYRQTSNRFCHVARVNVPQADMRRILRKHGIRCKGDTLASDEDWYRRCVSHDTIEECGPAIMKQLRRFDAMSKGFCWRSLIARDCDHCSDFDICAEWGVMLQDEGVRS